MCSRHPSRALETCPAFATSTPRRYGTRYGKVTAMIGIYPPPRASEAVSQGRDGHPTGTIPTLFEFAHAGGDGNTPVPFLKGADERRRPRAHYRDEQPLALPPHPDPPPGRPERPRTDEYLDGPRPGKAYPNVRLGGVGRLRHLRVELDARQTPARGTRQSAFGGRPPPVTTVECRDEVMSGF